MPTLFEFRRWSAIALCVLLTGVAASTAAPATNRYVVKNNPNAAPPNLISRTMRGGGV